MALVRLFAVLAVISVLPAHAAPGDLDPSFGAGGVVLGDHLPGREAAWSIVAQADGRLVVGGYVGFTLSRYLGDGSLDTSFATDGVGRLTVGDRGIRAKDVAVHPDGRIVAAGRTDSPATLAIVRVDADGIPDASFGTEGIVLPVPDLIESQAFRVVLADDGKIVVVGHGDDFGAVLVRLDADGALDPTFGNGGVVLLDGLQGWDFGLVVEPGGAIVVAGVRGGGSTLAPWAVVRLDPDGSLDAGFGTGGIAVVDLPSKAELGGHVTYLTIEPDGRMVLAGGLVTSLSPFRSEWVVVRLTADGRIDETFGTEAGVTGVDMGDGSLHQVLRQADGKFLMVGSGGGTPPQIVVGRFNADGTVDPTFGNDGFVGTSPTSGSPAWGYGFGAVVQADGRLVTAGARYPEGQPDVVMLARYETTCPVVGSCTPCIAASYLADLRLKGSRVSPPSGDEVVTVTARGGFTQPIDPIATGLRLVLQDAGNDALLDATVPGGAFDAATKAGWKGGGGKFTYRNAGTVTVPAGGIRKIALKIDARGRLSVKVVAKQSAITIAAVDLPLQAWIALDPPTAETGACVVSPRDMSCALDATGGTLRCD